MGKRREEPHLIEKHITEYGNTNPVIGIWVDMLIMKSFLKQSDNLLG